MIWHVSWSKSSNGVDIETTANIEAISATDAVKTFILMFPEVNWKGLALRAEKNNTFFIFIVDSLKNSSWFGIKLRRI